MIGEQGYAPTGLGYLDRLGFGPDRRGALVRAIKSRWAFWLMVVAPTVVLAVYYFLIASNQYESEADFMVRGVQPAAATGSNIGQILGLSGGLTPVQTEAYSISDYLLSHDAVSALDKRLNLVDIFRRSEADPLSRLWSAHPSAETLLRYYRRHVTVTPNQDTAVSTLSVRAFRPADAQRIAEVLLELGEQRVNALNRRAEAETIRASQEEVARAETDLDAAQKAMTKFRTVERDVDPEKTEVGQLALVNGLHEQLAQARAQLTAMGPFLSSDSPQQVALQRRIAGLEAQIGAQATRLTGAPGSLAPGLADYEQLKLRRDFEATRFAQAEQALSNAHAEALKQQLFVVRVVEPNLPEKSLYPRRWLIVFGAFIGLMLAYGIGWLVFAGVREHAG
jgi:capsular polysaccharide transport system permease protein